MIKKKNHRGCTFWTGNEKNQFKINDNILCSSRIKENNYGKNNYHDGSLQGYRKNKNDLINNEKFYGLAKSGKNKITLRKKENNIYQSKYTQVNELKDENVEFIPTKMSTLVMKPKKQNEDTSSNSSDLEKEMKVQSDNKIKFQRLGAINVIKIDEKNIKRNRRMFSFMLKHLRKAQKEHKLKKNTTLKLIYMAKELREKQKKFVQKKFKERQIEKFNVRTQQRRKKIQHLEWKYIHNENVLLANKMKSIFLNYCDLLNTKTEPIIFFRPKMNEKELQGIFRNEIDCSSFRLRTILEKRLKIMLETEGECPSDPDSLPFENSPYAFRFNEKVREKKSLDES